MNASIRRPLTADEQNKLGAFSPVLSHLLYHRGITDAETANDFIAPDYDRDSHDPFLLKDAEKSADRIIRAIKEGEKIAVYSDYDADGIPAAAMFNDFFRRIGYSNFIIYIPHRHNEGFGLNISAIEELAEKKADLVITLDCGISDIEPVKRANELKMQVIITDHHEPPAELPPAFAIIDHKQSDCAYPDKGLCGTGVGYKLIQAIIKKSKESNRSNRSNQKATIAYENLVNWKEGMEKWLLDLVGMATLSDMVPLMGENRAFAHYGLQVLRKSPRKGLVRLPSKLKINQRYLTEDDIAFMITPRINAASRMGVPMDAFHLLAADTDDDADTYANHLDEINNERKGVVASLVKEVKKTVNERHGDSVPSVIVLGNPEWKPSLLGLAANSCAEAFNRPVFFWGRDGENLIKGSCRSEGSSNVVEIMRAVPIGVFTQFGGHKYSGGFGVSNESVHFLEQRLNEAIEKIINSKSETDSNIEMGNDDMIDMELSLNDVDWNFYNDIAKLAPFGVGNPKPTFIFRQVAPTNVRIFGKGNEHIELTFKNKKGAKIPAISFFGISEKWADAVHANKPIDLIASIEKSMFRGRPELRLRVVDVLYS